MEERKRRGEASEASRASDCETVSGGGLWKTSSASEKAVLRGGKLCEDGKGVSSMNWMASLRERVGGLVREEERGSKKDSSAESGLWELKSWLFLEFQKSGTFGMVCKGRRERSLS